jgi:hypothetical protein
MCEHLTNLETELHQAGIPETFRGQAWSRNCREWVYFNCYLDLASIRARLHLPACVADHVNEDEKSGRERGFVCQEHHDAIMGVPDPSPTYPTVE